MKIKIKYVIISVFLLLALVFVVFYIFGIGNSQNQDYNYSTKGSIEPPFSNISQGKSLPGTWEYKNGEETIIVAFNSDETCEVYIDSRWKVLTDMNIKTLIPGNFSLDNDELVIKLYKPLTPNINLKENSFRFSYSLSGDKLNLSNENSDYKLIRIS